MDKNKFVRKDLRVLQSKMVYCSGLPSHLTQEDIKSDAYFGQYGKVEKIVMNPYPNRNYCSAYLTFSHQFEAATAILACNEFQVGRSTLWCLFGTMKYCKFFLKKIECKNLPNCPYLHQYDQKNQIQIQSSPSEAFPQHEKMAQKVIKSHPTMISVLRKSNKCEGQLPEPIFALDFMQQSVEECSNSQEQLLLQKQVQKEQQKQKIVIVQNKTLEKGKKNTLNLDSLMKKLIIRQLERATGSRLLQGIKHQEKGLRQIIIEGLLQ